MIRRSKPWDFGGSAFQEFMAANYTNPDPLCHQCGKQFCGHKGNIPELTRELTTDYRKPADPDEWEKLRQYLMDLVEQARR